MDSMTAKLKDLEEDIRKLWQEFDNLKTGETILGCATKAEFSAKKLHRTPQAVRYMLNPELRESKQCLLPEPSETAAPQQSKMDSDIERARLTSPFGYLKVGDWVNIQRGDKIVKEQVISTTG